MQALTEGWRSGHVAYHFNELKMIVQISHNGKFLSVKIVANLAKMKTHACPNNSGIPVGCIPVKETRHSSVGTCVTGTGITRWSVLIP